jgi:putative SOS response-associated peptidase YedK
MCGRFTLRTPARDLVEIFELLREPELSPRYDDELEDRGAAPYAQCATTSIAANQP